MKKRFFALMLVVLLLTAMPAIPAFAAVDFSTATLHGLGIGGGDEATFSIGDEFFITLSADEPIDFAGGLVYISTNIPVLGNADAHSAEARILSFEVDGVDLGGGGIAMGRGGVLVIDIARPDFDEFGLADRGPFSSLVIRAVVANAPLGLEDSEIDGIQPRLPDDLDGIMPETDPINGEPGPGPLPEPEAQEEPGFPGWAFALIIVGVVGVVIIALLLLRKKP